MQGPWETLTITNHADTAQMHRQVNVKASLNWRFKDGSGHEVGGYVYLQRLPDTGNFRLVVEGSEMLLDKPTHFFDTLYLPVDGIWKYKTQPVVSSNSGKALAIKVDFKETTTSGLKWIQVTMPLVKGNCRKAKIFDEALAFADQERQKYE